MTENEKKEFWAKARTFHFECWATPAIYKAVFIAAYHEAMSTMPERTDAATVAEAVSEVATERLYDRFG